MTTDNRGVLRRGSDFAGTGAWSCSADSIDGGTADKAGSFPFTACGLAFAPRPAEAKPQAACGPHCTPFSRCDATPVRPIAFARTACLACANFRIVPAEFAEDV